MVEGGHLGHTRAATGHKHSILLCPRVQDPAFIIGKLTQRMRPLLVKNMLTRQEHRIEVCCEETMEDIQERYLLCNSHAGSYTWKRTDASEIGRLLDMGKTLSENGLLDERGKFEDLGLHEDECIPVVHLYFADDLTVA